MRLQILPILLVIAGLVPAALAAPLDSVQSQVFRSGEFRLQNGSVLPELHVAYETYGRLAADGRNAVLITHGYTSSHHAAGRYRPGGAPVGLAEDQPGYWDKLIGPGKAIDTDRFFVVSSNMLGSSYGSTAPQSRDARTGKRYGPDFPRIAVADIVAAQRLLLDSLGVKHLVAVAGPSYGGFQAFQWAVSYPGFMSGIVPAVTAPSSSTTPESTRRLLDRLATDPGWRGGRYYDRGERKSGVRGIMTAIRIETLKNYGIEAQLRPMHPDPKELEAAVVRAAEPWGRTFDAHSLVVLRRALEGFDLTPQLGSIKAKVLYVVSRTDKLFPPSAVPAIMAALKSAGVDARYFEIDSEFGHQASGTDAEKWAPALRAFMDELAKTP